jgi:hypothetical protein
MINIYVFTLSIKINFVTINSINKLIQANVVYKYGTSILRDVKYIRTLFFLEDAFYDC